MLSVKSLVKISSLSTVIHVSAYKKWIAEGFLF